ncbi:MAG: polysaccharide biosynthesis tyrosine autokinase [Candidatus Omnitrophica bacterium]|nr:polysaccharide biosynthesis tyrosine autokinase [Candidatus Omnitrophota bacterium]
MAQYELSLTDYWRILRKRYQIVAGSVFLLLLMTVIYLQRQEPVYQTSAKIKLEKSQMVSGNFFQGFQSYYENPMATESRVVESRLVTEGMVRRLYPDVASQDPLKFQHLVDQLHGGAKAQPIEETNIIEIVVTGSDPKRAADIANFTAEAYIETNLQERNKQARKVREFVEVQLTQTEIKLRTAEEAVRRMREQGTATGVGAVLQSRLTDLQAQLTNLTPRLTEAHPDIIRLKAQIAQIGSQLRALPGAELEFARLTRELEINQKMYGTLRERLEEARIAEAEKVPDASIIERAMPPQAPISPRKPLSLAIGLLLGLLLGCVLAFVTETMDTSIGTIEDVETLLNLPVLAVIPHVPKEEKRERRTIIQLKRQLRLLRAKPRLLFKPRKGVGRDDRLALHVHYAPNSITSEAYRILRTNLKLSAERKVILVTSSGPGEGKTTVLSNLGIVIAQGGAKTMLLASDLRRPELDRAFGLSREEHGLSDLLQGAVPLERTIRGLSDFILGKFGYEEAVKNPYLSNLFILSTGRLPENPVELIGSKGMQDLLHTLRSQFDVILVDAPPLLPVADSLLLAPYVDGVVLVYEVGRISRAMLLRAKTQLESVGAKVFGVVLNHVRPEVQTQPRDYYYYRQRYAYGEKPKDAHPVSSPTPPTS